MKRKFLIGLLVAALSVTAAMSSFAAGSKSSGLSVTVSSGGGGGSSSSSSGTISSDGTYSSSGTSSSGSTRGTTSSDGLQITDTSTTNSNGTATELSFALGAAETAGLPSSVVTTISNINAGADLNTVGTGLDLTGYTALVATSALRTETAAGAEVKGNVEVPVYVPNLVEGLGNIQILFYNNFGTWQLISPNSIDYANKTVNFTAPNSGTFTIIYK